MICAEIPSRTRSTRSHPAARTCVSDYTRTLIWQRRQIHPAHSGHAEPQLFNAFPERPLVKLPVVGTPLVGLTQHTLAWRISPSECKGMPKSFAFINVSISGSNHADQKKTIHIQAMREVRRRQREERIKKHQSVLATGSGSHSTGVDKAFFLQTIDLKTGNLGSLICLSLDLAEGHRELLSYFQKIIGPQLLPDDSQHPDSSWSAQWLRKAVSDPLLLAATCSHAAAHYDDTYGRTTSIRAMELRSTAFQELHQALKHRPSTETIAAIAMLVGNTILQGDSSEFRTHMQGLRRLIASHSAHLQDDALVSVAILLLRGPYCIMMSPGDISDTSDPMTLGLAAEIIGLSSLVQNCRELALLRERLDSKPAAGTWETIRAFGNDRADLECNLGILLHELRAAQHNFRATLDLALTLAALLVTLCYLRRFTVTDGFCFDLCRELSEILLKLASLQQSAVEKHDLAGIFWAAMVQCKWSPEGPRNKTYLSYLASMLDIETLVDAHESLSRFAWNAALWDPRLRSLVLEITQK